MTTKRVHLPSPILTDKSPLGRRFYTPLHIRKNLSISSGNGNVRYQESCAPGISTSDRSLIYNHLERNCESSITDYQRGTDERLCGHDANEERDGNKLHDDMGLENVDGVGGSVVVRRLRGGLQIISLVVRNYVINFMYFSQGSEK